MNANRLLPSLILPVLAVGSLAAQPEPAKQATKTENVRKWTRYNHPAGGLTGVVDAISETEMTVVSEDTGTPKRYTLAPIDLLSQGKRLKDINGGQTYLWSDVKKGDSVHVSKAFDDGEQKLYCIAICVTRRPGAKLPESQDAKNDRRYARDSLLNDIENGLDVSEADIAKEFKPLFDPFTGEMLKSGGFPGEYRNKLNVTRDKLDAEKAKKEKELKATPPKKDDKK